MPQKWAMFKPNSCFSLMCYFNLLEAIDNNANDVPQQIVVLHLTFDDRHYMIPEQKVRFDNHTQTYTHT